MERESTIDPRVERSKNALAEALYLLSREKDIQSISVTDICRRARLNRSTFYSHFTDQYDLFGYAIRNRFEQHLSEQLPKNSDREPDFLGYLIQATCTFMERFNSGCTPSEKQLDPLIQIQVQSVLYEHLLGWLEQVPQALHVGVSVDVSATTMSWAIFGVGLKWSQHTIQASLEDVTAQLVTVLSC